MSKTKRNLIIIFSVLAGVVLLLGSVSLYLWGTIEVTSEHVDYDTLVKKVGEYIPVPKLDENAVGECDIYYPKPEEGSKHHYGKYNNFTVRDKYFETYSITMNCGYVDAYHNKHLSYMDKVRYETTTVDGRLYYYKAQYNSTGDQLLGFKVTFDFGDNSFSVYAGEKDYNESFYKRIIKNIIESILNGGVKR